MESGYIKLPRSIDEWEYRKDIKTFSVWLRLLTMANYTPKPWNGIIIERGQCVTSYESLAINCGITMQNIRTTLTKLERRGYITRKSTNRYTVITICNYDTYQGARESEQQGEQQTTNNQVTTTNNIKKEKNIKEVINKGVFSDNAKKNLITDSYSLFIENIEKEYPELCEAMEPPNKLQYEALKEKYNDNYLYGIIGNIANCKTWYSYKYLYAAIKQYINNSDKLPEVDFDTDL